MSICKKPTIVPPTYIHVYRLRMSILYQYIQLVSYTSEESDSAGSIQLGMTGPATGCGSHFIHCQCQAR